VSTVLVTGASGFVGGHLARRLRHDGTEVHALLRPGSEAGDLERHGVVLHRSDDLAGLLQRIGCQRIYHLAALYIAEHKPDEVDALIDANIRFGAHLLEAMAASGCKVLVSAGTAWQNFSDADPSPVNLYAATKSAFDCLIDYYAATHGLCAVTLRIHDSFGPGDRRRKLLTVLREAAADGRRLDMSEGAQILCPAHVDDIAEAFIAAGDQATAGHQSFAVPGPQEISLKDFVALVERLTGRPIEVAWGAKPYRKREVMQPWHGPALPGWQPRIGLEDGLRAALRETPCSP